jgi:hypothetical protein
VKKNKEDARALAAHIRTLTEDIARHLEGRDISKEIAEQLSVLQK